MSPDDLRAVIDTELSGRRLLRHPFYQRWEAGELRDGELAAYAAQYRHFEAELPAMLRVILSELDPDSAAAKLVRDNLADEESNPEPHLTLFDRFAAAVDSQRSAPATATQTLLHTYRRSIAAGPAAGVAAVTAYEVQAPEIAATKARGLREHYAVDDAGALFWDVHASMDRDHAAWAIDALAALPDAEAALPALRATADAWWAFLDEREAAAPLG